MLESEIENPNRILETFLFMLDPSLGWWYANVMTKKDMGGFWCENQCSARTEDSLSLATCHPVQRSPNMRVADCATVWVCKCLRLIYLSALHLTVLTSTLQSIKQTASIKWVCLGAMTIYQELEFLWTLWFAREHHQWWGLVLGPFQDKQVGNIQSMRAKGKTAEKQLKLELGKT